MRNKLILVWVLLFLLLEVGLYAKRDLLSFISKDASTVFGVNVSKSRLKEIRRLNPALWKRITDLSKERFISIERIKRIYGYSKLDSNAKGRTFVIVEGRFNYKKIYESVVKTHKDKASEKKALGIKYISYPSGDMAVFEGRYMLLTKLGHMEEGISVIGGGTKNNIYRNKKLIDYIKVYSKRSSLIWFVSDGFKLGKNADLGNALGSMASSIWGIRYRESKGQDICEVKVYTKSAQQAIRLMETIKVLSPLLYPIAKSTYPEIYPVLQKVMQRRKLYSKGRVATLRYEVFRKEYVKMLKLLKPKKRKK